MRLRTALLAAALAVLVFAPAAEAARQDPETFPPGVVDVSNTAIRAREDFRVTVATDGQPEWVSVTLCRFDSLQAAGPEVCFFVLGAKLTEGAYVADTSSAEHPAWRDGWVLGYKIEMESGDGKQHAPSGGDYYRIVVGQDSDPAPQGSAVVEDGLPGDHDAADSDAADEAPALDPARAADSKDAPATPALALAGLALAALLARRRA